MELRGSLLKIYTLALSDMKGRYRNTLAGFVWVMFNPILMFIVHSLVFKYILNLQVPRYFVFLLSGLLPWIFVTSAINQTAHAFITQRDVLLSFQISPLSILGSRLIDNFINFIIPFFALLAFVVSQETVDLNGIWFAPLNMLLLFLMTLGLNILVSTSQVFFRDIQYIAQFIFNILYFLTPIFYPASLVPESLKFILDLNPVYAVIKPFQNSLWSFDPASYIQSLIWAMGYTGIILLAAGILWRRKKNELYLYI